MGRREQAGFDMDMGLNLSPASSMTLGMDEAIPSTFIRDNTRTHLTGHS